MHVGDPVTLCCTYWCVFYIVLGNVKKLENSMKNDEQEISKLKKEEQNKLEVYVTC